MNDFPITDPQRARSFIPGLDRAFLRYINDTRDLPFIYLSVTATLVLVPFAVYLFIPGRFSWWLGALYLAINFFGFFDRFVLMLHNTSHRPLFKRRYRALNRYIPWALSPFFGESPDTYYVHHVGMHHPEGNGIDDLSSTERYRRDSVFGFLHYFLRFLLLIQVELARYLAQRGRHKLLRRFIVGEGLYFLAIVAGLYLAWRPTLVVLVVPLVGARFLMMAGNWGQHAFVDAKDPGNDYLNSITCVNSRYNRRCFNDGYHIGHHIMPNRHWTEMPAELLDNREEYARQGALVFERIDFFGVWALLMLKRYDWLARFFVDLAPEPRSREQVIELLKARTLPIPA